MTYKQGQISQQKMDFSFIQLQLATGSNTILSKVPSSKCTIKLNYPDFCYRTSIKSQEGCKQCSKNSQPSIPNWLYKLF